MRCRCVLLDGCIAPPSCAGAAHCKTRVRAWRGKPRDPAQQLPSSCLPAVAPQVSSQERAPSNGAAFFEGFVSHFGDLDITGQGLEVAAQGSPLVGPIISASPPRLHPNLIHLLGTVTREAYP